MLAVTSTVATLQVEAPAVATRPEETFAATVEQRVGPEATAIVIASQRMD